MQQPLQTFRKIKQPLQTPTIMEPAAKTWNKSPCDLLVGLITLGIYMGLGRTRIVLSTDLSCIINN